MFSDILFGNWTLYNRLPLQYQCFVNLITENIFMDSCRPNQLVQSVEENLPAIELKVYVPKYKKNENTKIRTTVHTNLATTHRNHRGRRQKLKD